MALGSMRAPSLIPSFSLWAYSSNQFASPISVVGTLVTCLWSSCDMLIRERSVVGMISLIVLLSMSIDFWQP
eukprot:1584936-Prorocentrum_lima.AAC.1